MAHTNSILVIDNGSGICKVGTAGAHLPSSVFPSIIGKARVQPSFFTTNTTYIGEEALLKKGILNLKYPIENGIISNWEDMELLWKHIFAIELRCPSEDHPVLLTEPPLNPKANKEKMCETMFESLSVPALYIGIQAVLSLYSTASTTGLVVDIGDGVTHIVPTYEGYTLPHAIQRINIAGREITKYLSVLMSRSGQRLATTAEFEICRDIKETACYVALDYEKEILKSNHEVELDYMMPDGNAISLFQARFQAPELLFKPELGGFPAMGLQEAIVNCIQRSDIDIRRDLYENILLSGGSTMFQNFEQRLTTEVKAKSNTSLKVKVTAPEERRYSVWIGGSILASLDSFRPLLLTQEEYYEHGCSVVHRKFF